MTPFRIDDLLVDFVARRRILALWAVVSAATYVLPSPAVMRGVVILPFMLLGPGAAIVGHLRLRDAATDVALSIGVSLSLEVLVALVFLYTGSWSSSAVFAVLVAICLGAVVADIIRDPHGSDVQIYG